MPTHVITKNKEATGKENEGIERNRLTHSTKWEL